MNGKNIIIAIIALAVLGVAYMQFSSDMPDSMTQESTTMEKNAMEGEKMEGETMMMKDLENGTYEATGEYISPAGPESIDVTLTLEDGVVTDAEVISNAVHEKSKVMQGLFIGAYESEVVGKNVSDISLDVVGGSSLTPKGFQDALDQIVQQAQS